MARDTDRLTEVMDCVGAAFHPDTDPAEYVTADGAPLFTHAECAEISAVLDRLADAGALEGLAYSHAEARGWVARS